MKLGIFEYGRIDLVTDARGLLTEDTLRSAVLISLFTDRRAARDDALPDAQPQPSVLPANRRGWCGDALADVRGDLYGSRLWLLDRTKQTEETRRRAIFYGEEALQWMIEDGHVVAVTVEAEWHNDTDGRLNVLIYLSLLDGSTYSITVVIGDEYAL